MNAPREYTPLTRRAHGIAGRYRLYLGADHLLHVHEEHIAERYQRFYFRDIQAIHVHHTLTREVFSGLNVFALILSAFVLTFLALADTPVVLWVIASVITLGWLVSLIINNSRGKTCACFIQTAVGTEQLRAVNRLRTAERVISRIQPLIEATQPAMNRDDLLRLVAEAPSLHPPPVQETVPTPTLVPPPMPVPATVKHCRGRAHIALAVLLALDVVVSLVDITWPMTHDIRTMYAMLTLFAAIGLSIGALIAQANSDLPQLAKTLTWANVGFLVLALLASVALQFTPYKSEERVSQLCFDTYSVVVQTGLCYGFWQALRRWR